jgi:hypothetical protein
MAGKGDSEVAAAAAPDQAARAEQAVHLAEMGVRHQAKEQVVVAAAAHSVGLSSFKRGRRLHLATPLLFRERTR